MLEFRSHHTVDHISVWWKNPCDKKDLMFGMGFTWGFLRMIFTIRHFLASIEKILTRLLGTIASFERSRSI